MSALFKNSARDLSRAVVRLHSVIQDVAIMSDWLRLADLQARGSGGSNGSADVPASTTVPARLINTGNCLQLLTNAASQDMNLQSPAASVR